MSSDSDLSFINRREKKKIKKVASTRKKSRGSIEDVVCQVLPDLEDRIVKLGKIEDSTEIVDKEEDVDELDGKINTNDNG